MVLLSVKVLKIKCYQSFRLFNNDELHLYFANIPNPDFVLLPISITRFAAKAAADILNKKKLKIAVYNIFRIKPFFLSDKIYQSISNSKYGGLVIDDDYVTSPGISNATQASIDALSQGKVDVSSKEGPEDYSKAPTSGRAASGSDTPGPDDEEEQLADSVIRRWNKLAGILKD